jgi:hypothetical protein
VNGIVAAWAQRTARLPWLVPTSAGAVGAAALRPGVLAGGPAGTLIGRYLEHPGQVLARLGRDALAIAVTWAPRAGPPLAVAVVALAAARWMLRRRQHAAMAARARTVTLHAPPAADPVGGALLWGNLAGLLRPPLARLLHGQPHLAFEYAWSGRQLTVSLWVPGTIPPGMIERAAEAAWPGCHAIPGPAIPPLPDGVTACTGGTLRLARPEVLPLEISHDTDPLLALAAAGSGLGPGEQAVVQVLARPVTGARARRARRAVRRLRAGQPARPAARLLDLISPGTRGPARRAAVRSDPQAQAELRAAAAKTAGVLWEARIRYAAATTDPEASGAAQARAVARLRGHAHAIASATALYSGRNWLARRRMARPASLVNARRLGHGDLLSTAELAAVARLPAGLSVPGLARAGARAVPPPPGIPAPGPLARPLGHTDTGPLAPVGIAVADGRHHLRIIGATGAGKTTLLAGQILADAEAGRGVVFIDPKGDAVTAILSRLPAAAAGRVVLFDPASPGAPPCLNVLADDGSGAAVVTDNLTGIFRRIYAAFWGPRTDDILRSALLTLIQSPPGPGAATLADVPALLGSEQDRRRITAALTDPLLRGFWDWYEQLSDAARAQAAGPLMNKLRAFLLRPFVRAAVAAGPSTFTMTGVLDQGGLLLARLPKGVLGEETSRLLGSFLVASAWQAASARARLPEHLRQDAALYLDECHNFLTLPYPLEEMLAEARAYRLALVMAHQNLAQLPPDLREGISANARSQVIFTASPEDARILERHTLPALGAHDLSHLDAYQAAARLIAGGQQAPAFTLRTSPLPPPVPGRAALIRRAAAAASRTRPPTVSPPAAGVVADPRRPARPASLASIPGASRPEHESG